VQAPRHPVQQHRRGEEERGEAQHHAGGDVVVQRLVDVEGHAADEGEVDPDRAEEELREPGGTAPRTGAAVTAQVAADAVGVDDDEESGDDQRAVEQRTRRVAERAQPAEVQVPPQRVGRRHDGGEDASAENDEHCHREMERGNPCSECSRRRNDGTGDQNGSAHIG
jgi:hypothetical protein